MHRTGLVRPVGHHSQAAAVGHETLDLGDEAIDRQVVLLDEQRRTLVGEHLGVVDLVVLGGAGPGHHDGGRTHGGQLGDGAGTAAGDQQVGSGVELRHAVLVSDHAVQDARSAVASGRGPSEEAVADHVMDGEVGAVGEAFDGLLDHRVDRGRALRATHHGDDEPVVGQAQLGAGRGAGGVAVEGDDGLPHRGAGELGVRQRGAFERHRDRSGLRGEQLRHHARAPVVGHHDVRDAQAARGPCGREAAVPTHVDDHLGLQLAQQRGGVVGRSAQLRGDGQVPLAQAALQADHVEQGVRVAALGREPGLDTALCADVVDLVLGVAGSHEGVGDGQGG